VAVNYSSDREGAERVAQTITDNGGEAIAVVADVSKAVEVARLSKEVDSAFGRLDVLVNNAGAFRFDVTDISPLPCSWRQTNQPGSPGRSFVRRRSRCGQLSNVPTSQ
jgi:NAD(P)-dependent dehydrogenase (short-subunit alcohol dehydrogenase family)